MHLNLKCGHSQHHPSLPTACTGFGASTSAGPSSPNKRARSSRQPAAQNSHSHSAMVRLTVRLKHQQLSKFADLTYGWLNGRPELCMVIHYLLQEGIGSGLTVGPDCDGYLNMGMSGIEDAGEGPEEPGMRLDAVFCKVYSSMSCALLEFTVCSHQCHPGLNCLQYN